MYARVSTIQFPPGPSDTLFRYIEDHVRPTLTAHGCVELDPLYDAQTGSARIISYWKDAEAALGSEGLTNRLREQARKDLGFQVLDVSVYDVLIEESVAGPQPRAARLTATQGDVARIDENVRWLQANLPAYRAQPGFCGWRTLADRMTGKNFSISLWRDAAAMQAAETLLTQSRTRGAQELGLQFEPTLRFEVSVATIPMGAQIQQQSETHP